MQISNALPNQSRTPKEIQESFMVQYQKHKPSGFCFTIKCIDESIYKTKTVMYTVKTEDEDIGRKFVEMLECELKPIHEILKTEIRLNDNMDAEYWEEYKNAKICYVCKKPFINGDKNWRKVRDHRHLTGKYRGAAHNKCNRRMRVPKFIPILFHNLENKHAHLFVKSLGYMERDINCIPKTDEKYISFSKVIPMETYSDKDGEEKTNSIELRFLHSLKFTQSSLDALASNLGKTSSKH